MEKIEKGEAIKFRNLVNHQKITKQCKTRLEKSQLFYVLFFRYPVHQIAKLGHKILKRFVSQVVPVIQNALKEAKENFYTNVKAYLKNPYTVTGLILLTVIYPLVGQLPFIFNNPKAYYISEYYPSLHYFSYAIVKSFQPIIVIIAIMFGLKRGNFTKYYMMAPLAFHIVKAYYILTATSNAEYLNPPINVEMIILCAVTLCVFLYNVRRLTHKYYHGPKVSSLCRLIGILNAPGIDWAQKEEVVKNLLQKIENNKNILYEEI